MNLSERDKNVVWHPFTQHKTATLPFAIAHGKGAYLYDLQGKKYLDLISSWWVNLHGHGHPEIAQAIYQQALTLEHVIFSGFTHEPAVSLAEELLDILPPGFGKVFFSDNGSTAVEVALKMAFQYWRNQGKMQRRRFISFEHGYHGDTFGAMSIGKKSGFFQHFEDLFFEVNTFTYPATWLQDGEVEQKEQATLCAIEKFLLQYPDEVAALVIEPLIQGAGGMRMCRPLFLQKLEKMLRAHDVLIIYDEVMTGFSRTGNFFACQKANTLPDIICLSKGLTAGFLPMAVTVCAEKIYQAFLGDDFSHALVHGHSFTANPLGCAAALASLKLLKSEGTQTQIAMIERVHRESLTSLAVENTIKKLRYCGTIAAFEINLMAEYGSNFSSALREKFTKRGLVLRPLGNVIYFLPPYCITEQDLKVAYQIVVEEIQGAIA